jgi:tRNA threonylcarbamoyl adenosine modification protein YeaZ
MITLGIELSSRQGSVALLKDGVLLAEKVWLGKQVRHNTIFQTLEQLLAEAGVSLCEVEGYAVGRGPGSFSGMRMSLTIANALALPGGHDVRAVSSGAALAMAVFKERGAPRMAVVGDARRGQVWCGMFLQGVLDGEWQLIPYAEAAARTAGALVVSPEAERLVEIFPEIGAPQFPSAREVALLARSASEPVDPLYLHPPVFVEPKFG